jgi:signal transduction histidine kinase
MMGRERPRGGRNLNMVRILGFFREPSERVLLIVCSILIILIFFLDVSLQIGFVASILYVVPAIICIWSPRRRTAMVVVGVATLLTLLAVPLKPPGDLLIPLFNRPMSLIALWSVALLVDRWKIIDEDRRESELAALKERESTIGFLRLINESTSTGELIKAVTTFLQERVGVEAVGVRLREGDDFPYCETRGFPPEFVRSESSLRSRDGDGNVLSDLAGDPMLECMCGSVLCRRTDATKPFFTDRGSFWTNSTTELLATTPDVDRQGRNRCNGEGYESVALIPLTLGNEQFGLIQLNDRKKGRFDPPTIARLEQLAGYLAVAVAKFRADDQLRESEENLKKNADELRRSNEDLRQFAYVASHDLQEPLRMVTVYLSLLETNYRGRLDDRAQQYLDFAVGGGMRARELIRDLLDYTRIESRAKPTRPVSMEEVMDTVTDHLSVQAGEENAVITRDPLPCIVADDVQMANLLQNLISNAIKFHGKEAPRVHVSSVDKGTEWLFSVRDNGIGIDPQYREKIFVIFQRLHSGAEYPGTGIGLAIAKKIVERHGGKLWFESEPGKGSTFYFTVPKSST